MVRSIFQIAVTCGYILALQAVFTTTALAEKRVALLIGNSAYQHTTKLRNPRNDAEAMGEKLRSLGFETIEGYDLDFLGVRAKARDFAKAAKGSDIALFFYAGHGVAVNGRNYIVPVDARLNDETAVDFETVPVDMVTEQMKFGNGINLVLLDACRDNPLAAQLASAQGATRSLRVGGGLAEMSIDNAGEGLAIAFATSPGQLAEDGGEENSPFTAALLRHIGSANTDFTEIMSRVTGDVYDATEQRQRPWVNVSLTGPVVLNKVAVANSSAAETVAVVSPSQTVSTPVSGTLELQKFMFDVARESKDPADFQSYLDMFPDGVFAAMARNGMERARTKEETDNAPVQTAMLQPTAPAATRSIVAAQQRPLLLYPSAEMVVKPATESTEQALFLDKQARRIVQARLNASGNNVGTPDGSIGPKSRNGLRAWQQSQGLMSTGYLNQSQLELLVSQTEQSYQQFLTAPVQHSTANGSNSKRRQSGNNTGQAVNSFLNGLGRGIGEALGK